MAKAKKRDSHTLRSVAVEAVCDERTVARFLRGEPVHSTTRIRLERALRRLKIDLPVRKAG